LAVSDAAMNNRAADLERIRAALEGAAQLLSRHRPGEVLSKANLDPVTDADLALDRMLRESLVREGEGWLSEETADQPGRLSCSRVWVVDPLDGTREFVAGIPEWCVSIGLVEDGRAVAGGVLNPAAGFVALGAVELGCSLNGRPAFATAADRLEGATILASRTEVERGEWGRWREAPFAVQPMGSVAYKLARVACGLADATWTLVPKHEWDIAAGVALVEASGGWALTLDGTAPRFNRPRPWLSGLIAGGPKLATCLTPGFLLEGVA
jgi:myo-inositol-1(or 4)-monophosphatase